MSVSWEANCCAGPASVRATMLGSVLRGERAAMCLAQPGTLDCTVCKRTRAACISATAGSFMALDVLHAATPELSLEQLELVVHKLASIGRWPELAEWAALFPLSVAPLAAELDPPAVDLAEKADWRSIAALARAGILNEPIASFVTCWVPTSCRGVDTKAELIRHSSWLSGISGQAPSRLVESAVKSVLGKRLPLDIVSLILKYLWMD